MMINHQMISLLISIIAASHNLTISLESFLTENCHRFNLKELVHACDQTGCEFEK